MTDGACPSLPVRRAGTATGSLVVRSDCPPGHYGRRPETTSHLSAGKRSYGRRIDDRDKNCTTGASICHDEVSIRR